MNSELWLNEMVWCGFFDYTKRKTVLWRFTKYGLIPFLKSHGYVLYPDEKKLSTGIASVIFHNWGHTLLTPVFVHRDDDYGIEHKQHFNDVIGPDAWNTFWDTWSWWEDVSLDSERGLYRRLDIQEYCWSQLDLSSSAQTRILEEMIEQDEPHQHQYDHDEY
jgi:hypothetical protein